MNEALIVALEADALDDFLRNKTEELNEIESWYMLGQSEFGGFMRKTLSDQLERVRNVYRKLPVTGRDCGVMLAAIQSQEEVLALQLDKLTDAEKAKKTLDEEIKFALNVRRMKQEERKLARKDRVIPEALADTLQEKGR